MRGAKRLAVLVITTMLLAVIAIPAFASHSFEITVDGTATLNEFKTVLAVTGTYTCTEPAGGLDADNSGFGGEILQEQKGGKFIVHGGFGVGGEGDEALVCDGTPQEWSADVQAEVDGVPAVWKRGRVIANGGGQVCDVDCSDWAGANFLRSVKITK